MKTEVTKRDLIKYLERDRHTMHHETCYATEGGLRPMFTVFFIFIVGDGVGGATTVQRRQIAPGRFRFGETVLDDRLAGARGRSDRVAVGLRSDDDRVQTGLLRLVADAGDDAALRTTALLRRLMRFHVRHSGAALERNCAEKKKLQRVFPLISTLRLSNY